jgi:hypothetical protein
MAGDKGASGSIRLTADSVVGTSGRAVRLYSVHWLSGAAAGTLVLRNGTSATSEVYLQKVGTALDSQIFDWGQGLRFPAGCFYDHDANTTFVVIEFETEL